METTRGADLIEEAATLRWPRPARGAGANAAAEAALAAASTKDFVVGIVVVE